jgi:arylsulfatase A-like enzyme
MMGLVTMGHMLARMRDRGGRAFSGGQRVDGSTVSFRHLLALQTRPARMPLGVVLAAMLAACSLSTPDGGTTTNSGTSEQESLADLAEIEPSGPGAERPNIVLIMADDMRADELRWMPRTRRLLAGSGVRFTNSFAPHPVCCPARTSTLTGQYTHNHKVYAVRRPWGFQSFADSETLAAWLQRAGYNTLFLGKYLNGYGIHPPPDDSAANSTRYVPPGWSDWRGAVDVLPSADPSMAGGTYRYFDMTLNVNGTLVSNSGQYSTNVLGDHTVDMIHDWASKREPFFLWANYVAPHHGRPRDLDDPEPFVTDNGREVRIVTPAVPGRVRDRFNDQIGLQHLRRHAEADVSDKPVFIRELPPLGATYWAAATEAARQRAESLNVVDAQVARTVSALRASGELDNTIIAFTSDNGYFLGEHRIDQAKNLPYEPALRIPMLLRGPDLPRGEVRRDPFLLIDLAPTFLAAADADPSLAVDGQSMLHVARVGDRGWRRAVLTETGPRRVQIMVNGEPRATVLPKNPEDPRFSIGIRTARYLYVEHANHERELYDLRRDPGELHNRIGAPAYRGEQRKLASTLQRLRDCVGVGCRVDLPASLRSG